MNVYFRFTDSLSNPLTGSVITLRSYNPPQFNGSSFSYGRPVSMMTDGVSGSVTFTNVVPSAYKVSVSEAGTLNPSVVNNFNNMLFFINVPSGSGTVNGNTLRISGSSLLLK